MKKYNPELEYHVKCSRIPLKVNGKKYVAIVSVAKHENQHNESIVEI